MLGLQPFKARKEFTTGHGLCCLYRQSHDVVPFQFPKDCLNGTLVPSLSKPSDRFSPNLVVSVCDACREGAPNGRRIELQQRTYCKRCSVASIDVLILRQTLEQRPTASSNTSLPARKCRALMRAH
jgi:hypothetical protein